MKELTLLIVGSVVALSACTVRRAPVGENQNFCDSDDECPDEKPRCDNDIPICFQCLEDSDCGGDEPNCGTKREIDQETGEETERTNLCECATDEDCNGELSCVDGFCEWL